MKFTDELIDNEIKMLGIKVPSGMTKREARTKYTKDNGDWIEAREVMTGKPWSEFNVDDIEWLLRKNPCLIFRNPGIRQLMKKFEITMTTKTQKIITATTFKRLEFKFDEIQGESKDTWVRKRENTIFNTKTGQEIIGVVLSPQIIGLERLHGLRPNEIDFSDIYTAIVGLKLLLKGAELLLIGGPPKKEDKKDDTE